MTKRFTKDEGKALWLQIVKLHIKPKSKGLDMRSAIEKLKGVKFTYGGNMRMALRNGTADKRFYYASRHFPSLIRMWKGEKEQIEK